MDADTLQRIVQEKEYRISELEQLAEELRNIIKTKDKLIETLKSSNALEGHLESPRLLHVTKARPHLNRKHHSHSSNSPEQDGGEDHSGSEEQPPELNVAPMSRVSAMGGVNVLMGLDLTSIKLRRTSQNKDEHQQQQQSSGENDKQQQEQQSATIDPPSKPPMTKEKPKAEQRQSPTWSSAKPGSGERNGAHNNSLADSPTDGSQMAAGKEGYRLNNKDNNTNSSSSPTNNLNIHANNNDLNEQKSINNSGQQGAGKALDHSVVNNQEAKNNRSTVDSRQKSNEIAGGNGDEKQSINSNDIPRSISSNFRRRRKSSSSSLSGEHKGRRNSHGSSGSIGESGGSSTTTNNPNLFSPTTSSRPINRRNNNTEKSGNSLPKNSEFPWKTLQQQQQLKANVTANNPDTTSPAKPVIVSPASDSNNSSWRATKKRQSTDKRGVQEIFQHSVEEQKREQSTETGKPSMEADKESKQQQQSKQSGGGKSWSNAVKSEPARTNSDAQRNSVTKESLEPVSSGAYNNFKRPGVSLNTTKTTTATSSKSTNDNDSRRPSTAKEDSNSPANAANIAQDDKKRLFTASYASKSPAANTPESEVRLFIKHKTGEDIQDLRAGLIDGRVLCKLANSLRRDGEKIKINEGRFTASHVENLTSYLKIMEKSFGMKGSDMFKVSDVSDGNFNAVIAHVLAVKRQFIK